MLISTKIVWGPSPGAIGALPCPARVPAWVGCARAQAADSFLATGRRCVAGTAVARANSRRSVCERAIRRWMARPRRSGCSVAATRLCERSTSRTRCLRLASLRPCATGPAARSARSAGRSTGSSTRSRRRASGRPAVPAAVLSTPACTPARNSSRSAALTGTQRTASHQSGAGSRGLPDAA